LATVIVTIGMDGYSNHAFNGKSIFINQLTKQLISKSMN